MSKSVVKVETVEREAIAFFRDNLNAKGGPDGGDGGKGGSIILRGNAQLMDFIALKI